METYTDSDFRTLFGLLKYLHTQTASLQSLQKTYFSQHHNIHNILALNPEVVFELDDGYAKDFIEFALMIAIDNKNPDLDAIARLLECWPECIKAYPELRQLLISKASKDEIQSAVQRKVTVCAP